MISKIRGHTVYKMVIHFFPHPLYCLHLSKHVQVVYYKTMYTFHESSELCKQMKRSPVLLLFAKTNYNYVFLLRILQFEMLP